MKNKNILYYFGVLLSNALTFLSLMSSIVIFKDNYIWTYLIYICCLAFVCVALNKKYTYRFYYIFGLISYFIINAIGLTFSILILDGM